MPKPSPEGDHSANAMAELGVREIKSQVRVIRSQLEANYRHEFAEDEPILAWIPRYGANCMNRYLILGDGRTPEQRRTGRIWKRAVVVFGEKVFDRPVARGGGPKEDAKMWMRP